MKKTLNGKIIAIMVVGMVILSAHAIDPALTIPRIGDSLPVLKLKTQPEFSDSAELCPAFTNSAIERQYELRIWAPAALDTTSTYIVTLGRDVLTLVQSGDSLYQTKKTAPGYTRAFTELLPYGYSAGSTGCRISSSSGKWNNLGGFITSGHTSSALHRGLSLITFDGDTIINVECCHTETRERMIYNLSDTSVFKSCRKQWYAPGYRYPLLIHEEALLFTEEADTLDHISLWYAIDDKSQINQIENDLANETLRQQRPEVNAPANHLKNRRNSDERQNRIITYDPTRNCIIIEPTPDTTSYLLCNVYGIVYGTGSIPQEVIHKVSTENLNPGEYVFYLNTSGEPVAYKFKVM